MRWAWVWGWLILLTIAACSSPPPPRVAAIRLLEPWTIQTDTAVVGEPAHAWQFVAVEAAPIRVRVQSEANLQVTLKSSDGRLLAAGRDMSVRLASAGIYSVEVQALTGEGGSYTIQVIFTDRTPAPTPSPTRTPSMPPTITSSHTPSRTPTPTLTFTPTLTPSATHTPTVTFTPSATFTPSLTPTAVWALLGNLIGTLIPGVEAEGVLISAFDRHVYALEVNAGAFITITASSAGSTLDPAITLYDPRGVAIAFDDDSAGDEAARILNVRADSDRGGTYYVQIIGAALSVGATGSYRLRADVGEPVDAAELPEDVDASIRTHGEVQPIPAVSDVLSPGQPVLDQLTTGDAVRRFLIETEGGVTVTLVALAPSGSDVIPRIEIVNPGGDLMLSATGGTVLPAIIPSLALLEGGTYSVYVMSDGGGGDVIVGYDHGETYVTAFRGNAPPDRIISGALTLPAAGDAYTLDLHAGDIVDLEISGDADGLMLALNGPDGRRLAQGNGRISGLAINETGPHEASIFALDGGTGAYRWAWRRVVLGSTPSPTPERIPLLTTDDVLSSQAYRYYPFFARAGQTVRVRVSGMAPVDPVIAVLSADGDVLAEADDSPSGLNPELTVIIPRDGTYTLRASAYNSEGGAVRVQVEWLR